MDHRSLRALAGLVATLLVALMAIAVLSGPTAAATGSPPAGHPGAEVAQEPDAPADDGTGRSADEADELPEPAPGNNIIPDPNSGRSPQEAGDRGGALQALVLVLIVGAVAGGAALVVRESRRARARASGG